jgi:hypothetical protein
MNRRKLSHVTAAGILAALLMLPGQAMAQSPHHRASGDLWSWLAAAWHHGMASLGAGGMGEKQGLGIDPNGGNPTGQGGATGQSAPTGSTTMPTGPSGQGYRIDPNG